jgi:type II secretory pathway pseudopilin PulG
MVGVLVIGILGGVIAATVFQVIPWAQNEAARQSLGSVATAQAAHRAMAGGYGSAQQLADAHLLEVNDSLCLETTSATSYRAYARSATGTIFEATSERRSPVEATVSAWDACRGGVASGYTVTVFGVEFSGTGVKTLEVPTLAGAADRLRAAAADATPLMGRDGLLGVRLLAAVRTLYSDAVWGEDEGSWLVSIQLDLPDMLALTTAPDSPVTFNLEHGEVRLDLDQLAAEGWTGAQVEAELDAILASLVDSRFATGQISFSAEIDYAGGTRVWAGGLDVDVPDVVRGTVDMRGDPEGEAMLDAVVEAVDAWIAGIRAAAY